MSHIQARQRLYRRERQSLFHGFDPVLTAVVGLLLFIGTLLVWAATRDWYIRNGLDGQYYLKRHTINILIGLVLAYGVTVIDYRLLRAYTPFLWGAGVLGLVIVLIPGLGSEVNGAKAWIALPGGFQIQPAELAKISIIIGMSMILSERTHDSDGPSSTDVLQSLAIAAIPVLLIILQPDMGTILIISAAVVTIIAVSGAPARWVESKGANPWAAAPGETRPARPRAAVRPAAHPSARPRRSRCPAPRPRPRLPSSCD